MHIPQLGTEMIKQPQDLFEMLDRHGAVSYTHLDVYKRQFRSSSSLIIRFPAMSFITGCVNTAFMHDVISIR